MYSSSSSDSETDDEHITVKQLKLKVDKYRRRLKTQKSKAKKTELPQAVQTMFNQLGGLTPAEVEKQMQPYKDIAEFIKIPKADMEMTTQMEWEKVDISSIKTYEDAQTLYAKDKTHPVLAQDMHARFHYRDTGNIVISLLHLRNKKEEKEEDEVLTCIDTSIKMGAHMHFVNMLLYHKILQVTRIITIL